MRGLQRVVRWTDCETGGVSVNECCFEVATQRSKLTTAVSFSSVGADMISTLPSAATTTFSSVNATDLRGLSSRGDCS